jgi:hypothetical protein
MLQLDHVTVGAADLPQGTAYLRQHLGIDAPPGSQHADMGTHNHVLRVGDGVFLELLAIDPAGIRPRRARWFGMDDARQAKKLAERPRPVSWVLSTPDVAAAHAASRVDLGEILAMSRGARSWRITVPESGMTAFDGCFPSLIQWSEGPPPANAMALLGPVLQRVILHHPHSEELRAALNELGAGHLAEVKQSSEPHLAFSFRMPDGSSRVLT